MQDILNTVSESLDYKTLDLTMEDSEGTVEVDGVSGYAFAVCSSDKAGVSLSLGVKKTEIARNLPLYRRIGQVISISLLCSSKRITYMLVISISGMVGVMVIMPVILRKLQGSMKKAVTYTQIICVVCYAILFFAGGKSILLLYMLTFIACTFFTMTNAFQSMTVVSFTDYVLLEKGRQMNGTISAIGSFSYKCGTAISKAIISFMLAATGYVAGTIGGHRRNGLHSRNRL